jgi:hypothetical protein
VYSFLILIFVVQLAGGWLLDGGLKINIMGCETIFSTCLKALAVEIQLMVPSSSDVIIVGNKSYG